VILWRLRGYSDPEGEWAPSEVVCSIERLPAGYRLFVEYGSTVQVDELLVSAAAAQEKAEALRAQLLTQGWTAAMNAPRLSVFDSRSLPSGERADGR
jgi:hypothetical protein